MSKIQVKDLARRLATEAGFEPDELVPGVGEAKPHPRWTEYVVEARERAAGKVPAEKLPEQSAEQRAAPLEVFGTHDQGTLDQMRACMGVGAVAGAALCADGHLGYAQPVGGVIAYQDQVSISGVGFDIACGNLAVRLDVPYADVAPRAAQVLSDIRRVVSFGVGRANQERVEHPVLDDDEAWRASGMGDYRQKAAAQLGTVGAGNHYVDLFRDEADRVWIGVHFGSRGLGHTAATRYLKRAGGKDGILVPPAVVREGSELGSRYLAAMELAGRYAYAGREWVAERVRAILGGAVEDSVHNHHNWAWTEVHDGRTLRVVRKGATPAFPGQRGFVGGSMGDNAVILEGVESERSCAALYSTVHGAGRVMSRRAALREFRREDMEAWLRGRGVLLAGGDLDESPMAYRRLPDVLAQHAGTVRVLHTLRPFAVAMAGAGEYDPFKD